MPFEQFLPVFQEMILRIGTSQIIVSNIGLVAALILLIRKRDWRYGITILMLLLSLPVTMFLLMPINIEFLEGSIDALQSQSSVMLKDWGLYQIIRFIGDGLALLFVAIPLIWPKDNFYVR